MWVLKYCPADLRRRRLVLHVNRGTVLACNACRKAAKQTEDHAIGRFLSWEANLLRQLSPAHRAVFPAVLTLR